MGGADGWGWGVMFCHDLEKVRTLAAKFWTCCNVSRAPERTPLQSSSWDVIKAWMRFLAAESESFVWSLAMMILVGWKHFCDFCDLRWFWNERAESKSDAQVMALAWWHLKPWIKSTPVVFTNCVHFLKWYVNQKGVSLNLPFNFLLWSL